MEHVWSKALFPLRLRCAAIVNDSERYVVMSRYICSAFTIAAQCSAAVVEIHLKSDMLLIVAGILYFVSSTVNPILYNVMSLRYRKAFRDTLHAALIAARCQQPDNPTSMAMATAHNRPLLRGNRSDDNLPTTNRRARSAESIRGWTPPHSQRRFTDNTQRMVTVTVSHTMSDEGPQTMQHSEC